eukprot:363688-Chlamydomonas_euryale.AAC.6
MLNPCGRHEHAWHHVHGSLPVCNTCNALSHVTAKPTLRCWHDLVTCPEFCLSECDRSPRGGGTIHRSPFTVHRSEQPWYARIIHVPLVTRSLAITTAAATSTDSMKPIRGARLMFPQPSEVINLPNVAKSPCMEECV